MKEKQIKTIRINLSEKEGTLSTFFYKIRGSKKHSEISKLRNLLSNEKVRLLCICKIKQPESIYKLAKLLGRDFKAVRHDVKFLEELGLIELVTSYKKKRERLRPIIETDEIVIHINLS